MLREVAKKPLVAQSVTGYKVGVDVLAYLTWTFERRAMAYRAQLASPALAA